MEYDFALLLNDVEVALALRVRSVAKGASSAVVETPQCPRTHVVACPFSGLFSLKLRQRH